jgi:hypothetical protein
MPTGKKPKPFQKPIQVNTFGENFENNKEIP